MVVAIKGNFLQKHKAICPPKSFCFNGNTDGFLLLIGARRGFKEEVSKYINNVW